MFAKSRKEKIVGQAEDLASDLSKAVAPHVERAREELAPRIAEAREQIAPRIAEARDELAPRIAEAREYLTPRVENARERVSDVAKGVAPAVATATASAAPVAAEAKRRGGLAAAALKGEPVEKQKSGKKKWFLLAAVAGAAAFVVQKMRAGESPNWQSSYTPTTPPAAPPAPPSPSAPMAGSHVADEASASDEEAGGDPVGATPGESLADATEEPHPVTTPDSPAETVEVSDVEDPQKP